MKRVANLETYKAYLGEGGHQKNGGVQMRHFSCHLQQRAVSDRSHKLRLMPHGM